MAQFEIDVGVRMLGNADPGAPPDPELAFIPGAMPDALKKLIANSTLTSEHPATEEGAASTIRDYFDSLAVIGMETWDVSYLGNHLIDRLTGQWIATATGTAWNFMLLRSGDKFAHDVYLSGRRERICYEICLRERTS